MKQPPSRARILAVTAATAGLCLTGLAAVASPTQAATGSCDTAKPVADLHAGDLVTGKTVTNGTLPTGFTGTVLGVLEDGIEPGVDLVMMNLDSTTIQQVGGIWEGMSGSPVYASDGSLIGAVAYTLSFGATPIAGITPWEDMQQYAGHAPTPLHVRVPAAAARTIAAQTDVTAAQASAGFRELKAPTVLAGLSPRALARATGRAYLGSDITAAGHASAAASPTVADMVAGGNLVATESTGDIVFGGLGTITSVCAGRVVGFGHPMEFAGRSSYGMAGADALFIQRDTLGSPYKLANIGNLLGTIDQDRMTGISGPLGPLPTSTPVSSTVTYHPTGGASRTRTGSSGVQLPAATAAVTFYELAANHQAELDAIQRGSENQSWTVQGHTAAGPFTFTGGNRYTDTFDIASASGFDIADLVFLLTNVDGVSVDSVHVDSDVVDSTAMFKIVGAEQRRGGTWHVLGAGKPALVTAGAKATLRLRYAGGQHGPAFKLAMPARAAGSSGRLFASAVEGFPFERDFPTTLGGVKRLVKNAHRNDQADVQFFAAGGKSKPVQGRILTPPGTEVVTGQTSIRFLVR
jgi:hypothetical protein